MKKELDEKLVKEFPNLYADRHASMQETCMCWGFPGDGWYQLIYDLSAKLETLILLLPKDQRQHIKASQVKEKFGTLRFYMTAASDEMYKLIDEAESASEFICETCGDKGQTYYDNPKWYRTHCPPCENKYQEERNKRSQPKENKS